MAGNFLMADIGMPDLSKYDTTEAKLNAIQSYLYLLLENLRYVLRNLSMEDNFNEEELAAWVDRLEVDTVISDTVVTKALYATYGDIAALTVGRLSTSRRIPKYLAGDLTDDNYILIENQNYTMMRGWLPDPDNPTVIHASNPLGELLYWEKDVEGALKGGAATLGAVDGYPYIDGKRVITTTDPTKWPVHVFRYNQATRWTMTFEELANYGPKMVWGHGDGTGSGMGRGYQEKLGTSFDLYYYGTDGVKRGVFMGEDYTDIVGLRKSTKLDFSDWNDGGFKEFIDGKSEGYTYDVEFDDAGDPVKITDNAGHVMEIIWPEDEAEEATVRDV